MAVIDDRGRLFGKVNFIDALVGVLVLGLIPLAYGAFLLFRVPAPKITSLSPTEVVENETATLQITGEDLRPFLRARFGTHEAGAFLVHSPTLAELRLPDLAVGTYDLALFDEAQELLRVPDALTVIALPPPPPLPQTDFQAVGEFIDLVVDEVPLIRPGLKLGRRGDEPIGEVLAVRPPQAGMYRLNVGGDILEVPKPGTARVPAIIRVTCSISNDSCSVEGVALAPNATFPLPLLPEADDDGSADSRQILYLVQEVRPVATRVAFTRPGIALQAVGRFTGLSQDEVPRIRAGLQLGGGSDEPTGEVLAVGEAEPRVQQVRLRGPATVPVATPVSAEFDVPVIVQVRCVIMANQQCRVGDTALMPDVVILLPLQGGTGQIRFQIDEVRPADAPVAFPSVRTALATLHVRFLARPEVVRLVKVGDVDVSEPTSVTDEDRASLTSLGAEQPTTTVRAFVDAGVSSSFQFDETVIVFTATLEVPVVLTPSGWRYRDKPVRVGASFSFETMSGFMDGWILGMNVDPTTERVVR